MKKSKFMAILLTLVLTLSMANGLVFNVSAASPKLNKKKVTITVGKTVKLKVKKNKAKKKVKWKSANKKIVKVTKKGKIKGIKPGKTVVTAKVGKKKLKCKVKVVAKKQTTKPTVKPTVPATTKAPVQTTQAPTTAKTTTIVDGKQPIEVIGLTKKSQNKGDVTFVWGQTNEQMALGQTYNVYVDDQLFGTYIAATELNYTFTTNGNHIIKVTAVYNGKETAGQTLEVVVTGLENTTTQVTTAKVTESVVEPTTTKPATTTKPSSENPTTALTFTTDSSIAKPFGMKVEAAGTGYLRVVWGRGDIDCYNVYVDGERRRTGVQAASYTLPVYTEGTHTVAVTTVVGTKESEKTEMQIQITGVGEKETEPVVEPTTTKPATTTKPSSENPTTALTFTTDSSIVKPDGMVVSQAREGYINVVWGRGSIDCYNIYIDGERRRTGVQAASYTLPVYTEGIHTVAVTTVVGTKESEKTEMQIQITGIGEKETEPETCPPELQPQLKENVPMKNDRIAIELNNKTNGKYSDDQIYWCILGNNSDNKLCYMDKYGNMIPASESLNTIDVNGKKYANIYHTLAESDHVYAPTVRSGRMYLSYGKPVYVAFNTNANGNAGYAGPDLNNPSDVNANTLFEFAEFTIEGKSYWGNTTRVDYFCFPMITRLVGNALYGSYDKTVGDIGTREEIFSSFKNNAPEAFKTLVRDDRIIAPCKLTFGEGKQYANYFDNYINEFWTKYSNEDLRFSSETGSFVGRVEGNRMKFTRDNDSNVYYIDKPTTQDVLEGRGAFDRGNGVEKAIEAQLCAAFNRGVATEPSKWYTPSKYYKNSTSNYYAGFFHEHSVCGLAYGFCYDDVNDQSTLLQYDKADALVIDLRW